MKRSERNAYWLSMFGQNILYCIISTGLLYYLQNIIFIPVAFIGIVISIAQIIDAVKDPVMGLIIDKTKSKYGKCRIYLIWGVPIITVATILPFINGTYSNLNSVSGNTLILTWVFLSYILWVIAFTLIDIPLWSLASCITEEKSKRENLLMGARVAAGIAGGIVPLMIVPLSQAVAGQLGNYLGNENALKYGTIGIAATLTIVGVVLMIPNNIVSKERVLDKKEADLSIREILKNVFSNKPYIRLLLSGIIRSPVMILGIAEMTMFSYYFGNNGREPYVFYMIFLGGGYLIGQILSTIISPKLLDKLGKRRMYIMVSGFASIACAFFWAYYKFNAASLIEAYKLVVLFLIFIFEGSGVGILNYLQSIMIVDCVDYQERYMGARLDGIFMSGQSLVIKISTGIATLVMSFCYSIAGFTDINIQNINELLYHGANFRTDILFAPYRDIIFFVCSIPAAIGLLISIIPMIKYEIN